MDRKDFHYALPRELIAQAPLEDRPASRLLALDGATGELRDMCFRELPTLLEPGDVLVMNDTRVLPARIRGRKASGGAVEVLLERLTGPHHARVQIRASRAPRPGTVLVLAGGASARIEGRAGALFDIVLDRDVREYLEAHGEIPLPPYITRHAEASDALRYQTVYAREPGAVAAPTAGLHFDQPLLGALQRRGVEQVFLTLHVGLGTFAPVRCERIEDHVLHQEWVDVSAEVCERIEHARRRGGRVIAVGTTTVRALESAAREGELAPLRGETQLFIRPGFRFRVVDAMITNFHLPESTLLMLVAAFAGRTRTLAAYRHAVEQRYRFFSYGDAMFVTPDPSAAARRNDAV